MADWFAALPPCQSVFGWRLMHRKLPYDEMVKSKGVSLPSNCELCSKAEESFLHLFLECEGVAYIWSAFAEVFRFSWPNQWTDFPEHVTWWTQRSSTTGISQVQLHPRVILRL
ncbi:uncharacterized protein LOC122059024 [Macadamia integrifolia]|uniref:uncharacterized protein LOC122059024 n=1 Tax=Macadamia integrifolia TaxID=60698 RepID=UPI001C528029|nr:uncharacterized protein LOC122059024 [Macadamia integrifolia]